MRLLPQSLALALALLANAVQADPVVQRGAYLVKAFGCADCHAPMKMGAKGPETDLSRGLSGHPQGMELPPPPAAQGPWLWGGSASNTAFWGPWGLSYAVNLTPDKATGMGNWTIAQFISAMRTGKHAGSGRPIAPPMPWQAIGQLNDADLQAMFRHLMAQPAIKNGVPAYQPPRG